MSKKKKPILVFLGTYPPFSEGISTFNQNLLNAIRTVAGFNIDCEVVAINFSELDIYEYPNEVKWKINRNVRKDYLATAQELNKKENVLAVIVQHEYGIFGGKYGSYINDFLKVCKKPIITVFHTVLPHPNRSLFEITQKLVKYSDKIVILNPESKPILEGLYKIDSEKISVILHGIHPSTFLSPKRAKRRLKLSGYTTISTFGLLGRNKGIDFVIRSLPKVVEKFPNLLYLILGQTHPLILLKEGEKYRRELVKLTKQLGLQNNVSFYNQFLSYEKIRFFLQATDLYISTSLDPNQSVSGTLSYALGSGRAVVSTEFSQAKSIISPSVGKLVPIKNPDAYSEAIIELLSNKTRLEKMHATSFTKTRSMLWPNVATEYVSEIEKLTGKNIILPEINLAHLKRMTNDFGIIQFSNGKEPDITSGYHLDDVARALILSSNLLSAGKKNGVRKLISTYFSFLERSQTKEGYFYDFYNGKRKRQNNLHLKTLNDSFGRAVWALAEIASNKNVDKNIRSKARSMYKKSLKHFKDVTFVRSIAYTLISLNLSKNGDQKHIEIMKKLADKLVEMYHENSSRGWKWFENSLTYANALIPGSLFNVYRTTGEKTYLKVAEKSLKFLMSRTFKGQVYFPVGSRFWIYKSVRRRSLFDEQPEDPASMTMALIEAYKTTHNLKYKNYAKKCFTWFLGNNVLGVPLYDRLNGGCYDALVATGVNPNQGAESLIMYLMARLRVEALFR